MHRRHAVSTGIGALLAGSLLLSGCGMLQNPFGGGSASADVPDSPLWTYLSPVWEGEERSDADYEAEFVAIEERVAVCMAQAGFEYIPQPYSSAGFSFDDDIETVGPEWGTLEFAEQYGYGIAEWPSMSEELMPAGEEPYFDPNMEYVESLSAADNEAYWETLYGPSPTEEEYAQMEESGNFERNPEHRGCYGEAEEAVRNETSGGADNYWDDPEFADLMEEIESLYVNMEHSPEISALHREWSTCMEGSGYPGLANPSVAIDPLYEEWNALHESSLNGEWLEPSDDAMKEFQNREIAMAVADWKCADKYDVQAKQQEAMFAAEEAFIERNKARLDALIATYGQAQ